MRKRLPVLLLFYFVTLHKPAFSQPGEWVWIHGSNTPNSTGNYGVQGVPDPANEPPAVYQPCEFTGTDGNFWFYGGSNNTLGNVYCDLWKYDPLANVWTWMEGPGAPNIPGNYGTQGIPSPTNQPPPRSYGAGTWTDNQGNFWMFGAGSGLGNDLWRYDVLTLEWTWMKGTTNGMPGVYGTQGVPDPANFPDPRYECVATWKDNNGDLWMFGGISGYNDLWRYTIATNTWTWMKGGSTVSQSAVYGVKGVEDPANTPGSRSVYSKWKDQTGNFWMWGGEDFTLNVDINEMWKFNPVTNNWTWIDGNIAGNTSPVYGTQCVADSLNDPGGRFENRACWKDAIGNFYFFGGGIDALSSVRNDLWKYCVPTSEWTWLKGSTNLNPAGSWGTMGIPDPSNVPNGRGGSVGWSDQSGNLYMFGGSPGGYVNPYNDLWKYTVDNSCGLCSVIPIALFTAPHHVCPGTCTYFNNNSINATSWQWIFPGGSPSTSTDENPSSICYYTPGQYAVTLIASNATGSDTLTLPNYITVYPFSPLQSVIQSGDTLIANIGFVAYQWFYDGDTISGATNNFYIATQSGDYSLISVDNNGCFVETVLLNVIAEVGESSSSSSSALMLFPNPAGDRLTVILTDYNMPVSKSAITFWNVIGETMPAVSLPKANSPLSTFDISNFSKGVYFIQLSVNGIHLRARFIKQ